MPLHESITVFTIMHVGIHPLTVIFCFSTSLPSTIDPTVATNALRKKRSLLLNLIRHCLPSLANSLFADSIIPQDVCERACNKTLTSSERGVALLDCVESRIEALPSDFTKVVHILEAEPFLAPGVKELCESYCEPIEKLTHLKNSTCIFCIQVPSPMYSP